MSTATIHVTKLTAAKRQIQAALRLFFMEEDELAVHTVSSAAYGLLKDLKRARGRNEAAETYQSTLFYLVRDFRRGTLPSHMTNDPATMAEIERLAEQLSPITADSHLSDVQATISSDTERNYWNQSNKAANFLKHADRDSDGAISMEQIDNFMLLMKCCASYRDIAPDELGNEGLIFQAFVAAGNPAHATKGTSFDSLVASMRNVPTESRKALCQQVLLEMKGH
jgi:hypothetical protein